MRTTIAPEPWDSPDATRLREAQQTEINGRYGWDAEPGAKPSAADVTVLLIARGDDGEAVGCGALRALEDGAVELKRMYVAPAGRRRGLGLAILRALEAEAVARGHEVARLESGHLLPEAHALYLAAGYYEIPNFGPYVGIATSRCFERRLTPGG